MANELKQVYAGQVTLEANGAAIAADAFGAANDASLAVAQHNDYPLADFALTCAFGAPVGNVQTVNLYRQDLDIDGTADAPAPAATYKSLCVASFLIPDGQSASATYPLSDVPLSKTCQFSLENKTGQMLSAGWILKATPKTYGPV